MEPTITETELFEGCGDWPVGTNRFKLVDLSLGACGETSQ